MFSMPGHAAVGSWSHFKHTFIKPTGSVYDIQQGIHHSEGQGYGMLLAVHFNDKDTFDTIWKWTKRKLQVRNDYLFSWSYGSKKNSTPAILDRNNATDGDLLIAYSLLKGYQRWQDETYKKLSLKILDDIQRKLSFRFENKLFLLPGYYGFIKSNSIVWNPSYQIPSAYQLFSVYHDKRFWDKIFINANRLLVRSSDNPIHLPPDWVTLRDQHIVEVKKNATFGYEAIRVLLYQLWLNEQHFPKGVDRLLQKFESQGTLPATISMTGLIILDNREASAGFYQILSRIATSKNSISLANKLSEKSSQLLKQQTTNYYSQVTYLLAQLEAG